MIRDANREYADSLFRTYFREEKRLKALFSALTGIMETDIESVEIRTLENVIYGHSKNDLAAVVNHVVIMLVEHQTTINGYMPVRMNQYMAQIFNKEIDSKDLYKRNVRRKLPAPQFYVLYNGRADYPVEGKQKLSELFIDGYDEDCSIELTAKVININYDKGHELLGKCKELHDYALFVHTAREYQRGGYSLDEAVNKAVADCIAKDIMADFLIEHGKEARNMLTNEITIAELIEIYVEEAKEEGLEEGLEKGMEKGMIKGMEKGLFEEKRRNAKNLKKNGVDLNIIANSLGLTPQEVIAL